VLHPPGVAGFHRQTRQVNGDLWDAAADAIQPVPEAQHVVGYLVYRFFFFVDGFTRVNADCGGSSAVSSPLARSRLALALADTGFLLGMGPQILLRAGGGG